MTAGKALHRLLAPLATLTLAVMLVGCPTQPRVATSNAERAEAAMRSGDAAGAAALYERLATQTTGTDSIEFRLRAARAWLAAGRPADADRVLASIGAGGTQQQVLELKLLGIQSAAAQGRGDEAWRDISSLHAPTAPAAAARYYETRQQVAIATGHLSDGIRAEFSRERVISPGEIHQARSELLAQLRAAAEHGASLAPPPGSDALLAGWLEAASVAADNARNPTLGATRLAAFRARYPTHPALGPLANEPGVGVEAPGTSLEAAPHLALILPLTGRTAAPAAQIRDGFMTAYYQLPQNVRPRLRVYDSANSSIADTIAQATAAGAEFIVGPLTREEVADAANYLGTRPQMLALNFLPPDRPAPGKFFQFALSPEDDARAVARYIGTSGRRFGVIIAPEGDWGSRVATAFEEELRAAGGYVLGQATYNPSDRDYGAAIMQVLRTDDSRARQQRIQAAIGQKLEFEPRRRADIQFIFAPSMPGVARLLRPQLRYHLAGDIPTYMLGDAFEPHPTANQEIDGVMFPDMPWMLGGDPLSTEVRGAAAAAFGDSASRFGRLFAFGYDAMRIANSLQRGAPIDPRGLTGTLSLDPEGHVRRELQWMRVRGGTLEPLENTN
jgi:outer membrane PBP1 activator LpoA protein